MGEAFPTSNFLWNLVNEFILLVVGTYNWLLEIHLFRLLSIILLLEKNFKEKNPNYLNFIIATSSIDFINLCLFN